jgi:transcriptional regulator with PAS, ATPase and Fis domain
MTIELDAIKILNNIAGPVIIISPDYEILDANKAAVSQYNTTKEAIVGQKCHKVTHKYDKPCWEEGVQCPLSASVIGKKQNKVIHQHEYGGKKVFEEIITTPVMNDQNEVVYLVEEFRNINAVMKHKEIIDHLRSELEELKGIIPICASCKSIRDDNGYWQKLETYISQRSAADFSHGICPDCIEKFYSDFK